MVGKRMEMSASDRKKIFVVIEPQTHVGDYVGSTNFSCIILLHPNIASNESYELSDKLYELNIFLLYQ